MLAVTRAGIRAPVAAFCFMRKRGSKYRVEWGGDEPLSVSAFDFHRAISSGWLRAVDEKRAVLADGVRALFRAGVVWLVDEVKRQFFRLYTSWIAIERVSPIVQGPYYQRTLEQEHCGPRSVEIGPEGPWWERCNWIESGAR